MKLKYMFLSFAAALTLVSCSDDDDKTFMDELQVSQSYVTIAAEGGSTKIVIDANADWTFDFDVDVQTDSLSDEKGVVKYNVPTPQMQTKDNNWVTITPSSGSAGKTEVTFSAEAASDSREIAIRMKIGNKYQNFIVAQTASASETPVVTVKDVLNGVDSKTYRVKGSVSSIASTVYGNWYLSDDEGNSVYIYGTLDKNGNTKSNPLDNTSNGYNIELGDVVTIEGPRTTYGSTIELVDVKVIKVEKALLKSASASKTIEKAAGTFDFVITQKGEGLQFSTDCDWLSFAHNGFTVDEKGNYVFSVKAEENSTGATRSGNLIFESTKGSDKTRLIIPVKQLDLELDNSENASLSSMAQNIVGATKNDPYRFYVALKDAKVTYKSGSNTFIEDATGGLLIYNSSLSLKVGDIVNGGVYGSGYGYNGLPEATEFSTEMATVKHGDAPEATVVSLAELAANFDKYVSRFIRVKDVTVEEDIDVIFSKVKNAGKVTDGTNTFALNHKSTSKYDGKNIFFYLNVKKDDKVSFVCVPSVNKDKKQLDIWTADWFK